jgi:hypothetical protein
MCILKPQFHPHKQLIDPTTFETTKFWTQKMIRMSMQVCFVFKSMPQNSWVERKGCMMGWVFTYIGHHLWMALWFTRLQKSWHDYTLLNFMQQR